MPIARIRLRKAHAVLDKDLICSEIMDPFFSGGQITAVIDARSPPFLTRRMLPTL